MQTSEYTGPQERRRIRKILLAGNPYDAFILEEAGCTAPGQDPVEGAPSFDLARNGEKALARLRDGDYDLLITDYTLPDISGPELVARVKQERPEVPAVVLTSNTDLGGSSEEGDSGVKDNLFIWYGATSLVRALVKLQEDALNAPLAVQGYSMVILLVEDEPNFYSHFVPVLYERIRDSSIALMPRRQRPSSPWAIIDNRPLVLLRHTFEDACQVLYEHNTNLMALITDMRFPVKGRLKGEAGLRLLYRARSINGHLPVAVHSREREHAKAVQEAQGRFLWKDSARLLTELDQFLIHSCGFGPFVFRWPAGERYGVARTLHELRDLLVKIPEVVFEHHALHHDFSTWMAVHGYPELAHQVRELSIRAAEPRQDVLELLNEILERQG